MFMSISNQVRTYIHASKATNRDYLNYSIFCSCISKQKCLPRSSIKLKELPSRDPCLEDNMKFILKRQILSI
jgi:hypothetical protein